MATTPEFLKSSEPVEPEAFRERVASKLGEAAGEIEARYGQVWLSATPDRCLEILRTLKEDPDLACIYFTFLSGVDWEEDGFEVVTCLWSPRYRNTVLVKVKLPAENPSMPSVTGIFSGANWHERETHEMFGIDFEGHPNLSHLYLSEDFEGHPLRKSFKLASRTYKPWPGAKDPEEAAGGGRT